MEIKRIGEKALAFDKYSGCSQSVLLALQEDLGIGGLESFKAATVLSGGVARRGETCGALLGGLLALGLVVGREDIRDTQAYRDAMKPANEIVDEFKDRLRREFGFEKPLESTICRDIQERIYGRGFDLNDPGDYPAFLEAGGHGDDGCPKVCGIAAMVTAEKLQKLIK
ncbi:C-GCAxxG-C-C family protein [Candidatus Bathyarchaeota archaeon]|nr:C-GCAxxG-C-C family protein [Candidatus Bathyarchaeota archaeon]